MLGFRNATPEDIYAVFSNLSYISSVEADAECGNWWKALPKALSLLDISGSQTEVIVDESGTPLAIFGHYPGVKPFVRTTLFVFTNGFMARGIAATLAGRRRIKALQFFYPGVSFHSFTMSAHRKRDLWFSLLGFHYVGIKDGARHYVLLESDKISDLGLVGQYNPTNPRAL